MKNSKLIKLIHSLDRESKRELHKYVDSPRFCTNVNVKKLLTYLLSRKYFSEKNIAKEKVFKAIFPKSNYNDLKLRHLMNLSIDFIQKNVRFFDKNDAKIELKIQASTYYRAHKLPQFGLNLLENTREDIEKMPFRDENYYLSKYRLEVEHFEWMGQEKRLGVNNLQELTQDLNHFYIISTLKYACIGLTHQNLKKTAYQFPLLDIILNQIEQGDYEGVEAITIYYYAFMALKYAENDSYFKKLKYYVSHQDYLTMIKDPKEVLMFAINYCIKRLNSGDSEYIREAFELYMFGLEHHILMDRGAVLSRFTFKNVIALGLRLKEFDWVAQFITNATDLLEPEYRDSQVNYNTARLYFYQGNFDKATILLQQAEFDDTFMNMDARIMLLKMYYLDRKIELLEALLNSFDVYLQRKKILAYHKDNYKNIIRFIRRLIGLQPFDKEGKEQLRASIEKCRPLTEKKWLLEQL